MNIFSRPWTIRHTVETDMVVEASNGQYIINGSNNSNDNPEGIDARMRK